MSDAEVKKHIDAMKGIMAVLDPEGKIKVTRTEALEWWDRARLSHKHKRKGGNGYGRSVGI